MFKRKNIIIILIICILFLSALLFFNRREGFFNTAMYTAVIVEPREHSALQFVMKSFLENLDERWKFIIFHGNKNEEFILDMIKNEFPSDSNRIELINLNVDNLTIADYNKIFVSKSFYEKIPTEMFLVFQTDTMICSNFKENIYNQKYLGKIIKDLTEKNFLIDNLTNKGETKYMGVCKINNIGRRIDIRVVNYESYFTSILYFTGSKDFNVFIRNKALEKNYSLNEYALTDLNNNNKIILKSEEEIFDILKIPYQKPNERN